MRNDAIKLCGMPWFEATKIYGEYSHVRSNCFLTMFISSLLINVYDIDPNQVVHVPKLMNNIEPSWTLGAILLNLIKL